MGWGRVFEVVDSGPLWLVKPAPTGLCFLLMFSDPCLGYFTLFVGGNARLAGDFVADLAEGFGVDLWVGYGLVAEAAGIGRNRVFYQISVS